MFSLQNKKVSYFQNIRIFRTTKRKKTIMLRIRNGEIEILCPFFTSDLQLNKIIQRKNKWIQDKIRSSKFSFNPISLEDNCFIFRFKKIRIEFVDKKNQKILFKNGILKIESNIKKKENKKKIIVNWLKDQASHYLTKRIEYLSKKISVSYKQLKIKSFKSRWGSCDSRGEILLNWKLIMLPTKVIDYVIVHELSHIKIPNHSKEFWNLVENKYPGYRREKKWLKEYGGQFIQV